MDGLASDRGPERRMKEEMGVEEEGGERGGEAALSLRPLSSTFSLAGEDFLSLRSELIVSGFYSSRRKCQEVKTKQGARASNRVVRSGPTLGSSGDSLFFPPTTTIHPTSLPQHDLSTLLNSNFVQSSSSLSSSSSRTNRPFPTRPPS